MPNIYDVLPVQVLIDSASGGTFGKMVFSPGKPKTALMLFGDAPPEVHDFGKAQLQGNKEDGYVVELSANTLATNAQGKPLSFRDPASCAAYRPGRDEVAMVFRSPGEATHDSTVWRFNPSTGSPLPSIYFDNPTSVAYSSDGEMLSVGGADGMVTVFRFDQAEQAVEVRTVNVGSDIRVMVFEELNRQLYAANGHHMLISFFFEDEDDMPLQRGVQMEDGNCFSNMCLAALAYSEGSNLIAYAGVGNEVWVTNPLTSRGRLLPLRTATRIHTLQFDDQSDTLTVFSDAGVELISFGLDSQHLPLFEERTALFTPIMAMVGCHHYSDFLFIASLLPAD